MHEGSDASNISTANGLPKFVVDTVDVSITAGNGNRNTGEAIVTVTDAVGNPLNGVAIEGSFSGDWNGTRNGTTNGSGQVTLSTPRVKNLSFVEYCVYLASKAGWELDVDASTFCGDSDGGGTGNTFGVVDGRVINAINSSGITNASVSTDTGQSGTTDAFGDYAIANVPVGNRNISVTASGYDGKNANTSVTENTTSTVNFALDETTTNGAGAIKGTVFSGSGGKVGGVTLQVVGGTSSQSNKGGKYTIQNVPATTQTVMASKAGYLSQQQDVLVVAGSTVTLNFTLAPE